MHDWQSEVRARLAPLRLKPEREADIVDEIAQHLAERYREAISGGASPDEATRVALAEFHSSNLLAQHISPLQQAHAPAVVTAGAATGHLLTDLLQDLRYAVRACAKQPGFAATAVLILALGIGATTAIFSLIYGVLLKPLPFDDPQTLVSLRQHTPSGVGTNQGPGTYLTYRENQQSFEDIGIWDGATVSVTGGGATPERVEALLVSSSTLRLLRVQPQLGRFFAAEDDVPGAPPRAVLSAGYWQRRFGGADDIVGRQVLIDGTSTEVIGVLPASFEFLSSHPAVLLPRPLDPAAPRFMGFGFQALARLGPGVTLEQANADVARMITLLPSGFERLDLRPNVGPLAGEVTDSVADILWILLAAVGVVLLIACGNVANLFLVRAEARHQELATRAALGASRWRLARTLLTESVVLALAGGVLGVTLATVGLALLRALAPVQLPRLDSVGIDPTVLSFAAAVSVASGVLFGLFAVARYGNPSVAMLKSATRAGSGPERHRTRNALVVGQVALALTLLIVSGLMIRTLIAMLDVRPGFTSPEDVQTFVVAIPRTFMPDDVEAVRTYQTIAEKLEQIPGVESVGLSSSITMDGEDNGNTLEVEGFANEGALGSLRRFKSVGPGYYETMGNPLVAGRAVTWEVIFERRPAVVISEAMAREYWREPADAIGKRVRCCGPADWLEIIGVSGNEHDDGLNRPPTTIVYWPMMTNYYRWRAMAFAVRSSRVGAPTFMRELEQAVWGVNPELPLSSIQTLGEIQSASMAKTSFTLVMLGIAASVALLLGVVGIYGVISYVAAQRTREIGIRIALGARLADVRSLFLRHGLWLTALGIALGIGLALVVTRVMAASLFGVGPMDPLTYAAVSALLAGIALLASYVPARRAARTDPNLALRADS